ncbi:MAG: HNH endonuclease [Anaerolineae bacterium]|nr:HNH endonuclease [Anaerolineae bacterium]
MLPKSKPQNHHTVGVLAPDGTRLNPTTPGKARRLKEQGKAKVERRYPVHTIRLTYWPKPKDQLEVQPMALHLDDGETMGAAVVQHNSSHERMVCGATSQTSGREMSDRLADRGRLRRCRKHLDRQKKGKTGHLKLEQAGKPYPPSIELDVFQKIRLVKQICRLFPISEIVIETVSVDIRRYLEPEVQGRAYQQPRTIEARVKWTLPEVCAVCGQPAIANLITHHRVKRKDGGVRNFTNEIPVCARCHREGGDSELCLDASECPDTRAFGRLQQGRALLLTQLASLAPVREVRGYQTAPTRQALGLSKTHIYDAVAAGLNGTKPVTLPAVTWQVHNPTRRTRKFYDENFGVAKYRKAAERQPGVDPERMRVDDHDHEHNRRNRSYRRHVRSRYYRKLRQQGQFNERLLGPSGKEIYSPNTAIHLLQNGQVVVEKRRVFAQPNGGAAIQATIRRNNVLRTAEGWLGKAWALMSNGSVKVLFTETRNLKQPFTQRTPAKLQIVSRKWCWLPVKEDGN